MVTYPLSQGRDTIKFPSILSWTREDVRAVLENPKVVITGILSVLVLLLSFVAALTFLAYHGKATEALAVVVITPVIALLVALLRKVSKVEQQAQQIQHQTNGATTRLLDAVLPGPERKDAP